MDFDDSPSEHEFRIQARNWLELNAPPIGEEQSYSDDSELVAVAKQWQAAKAKAGYAGITLPVEYGGAGLGPLEQVIFRQEQSAFAVPFGVFEIGLGMCIPTVLALGNDSLKQRFVAKAIRGEEIWCQLFSEPAAGSDLAALRTNARQEGDAWIINGQKVWTTGAHFSDYGLLLARSDPLANKHGGLTMFIVDMRAPGIAIRPIRMMTGESEFNEVFFTDVKIPDSFRLTRPGEGWQGARTTLMFERLNVGADIGLVDHRELLRHAKRAKIEGAPAFEDGGTLERLARWYINDRGIKLLTFRTLTALGQGEIPGPEQSIAKLILASQAQELAEFVLALRGNEAVLACDDLGAEWARIERAWSFGAAMRIAGGTDEILRNIIAERVLGLPSEPRSDLNNQSERRSR